MKINEDDGIIKTSKETCDWCAFIILLSAVCVRIFLFKSSFRPEIFDRFFYNYLIFPKYPWIIRKLADETLPGFRILDFSPLYTYLMTIFYKIFSERYIFYKLFQIAIGSMSCLLIYKITSHMFHFRVAVIAGLISIFYKPFIIYELILEPVTIIIFLNLLSVYFLIYCYDKHLFHEYKSFSVTPLKRDVQNPLSWHLTLIWFLPGITLGLSFITRPNILFFFCATILWIFFCYYKKYTQLYVVLLLFLLGFCLTISPVLIRNYRYSRSILKPMMSSGQVFYQGNNPLSQGFYGTHPYLIKEMEMDPHINPDKEPDFAHELYRQFAYKTMPTIESDKRSESHENEDILNSITSTKSTKIDTEPANTSGFWFQKSLNFITEFPLNYIQLILKKIRYFWSRYEIHDILQIYYLDWEMDLFPLLKFGIVIPFAILGMLLCITRIKLNFLLYAMAGNYFLSNLLFFVTSRQRLPALPFLIPFAAFAFYEVIKIITKFLHSVWSLTLHIFKSKRIPERPWSYSEFFKVSALLVAEILLLLFFSWFINLPSTQLENFDIMLHLNRESRFHLANAYDLLNNKAFHKAKKAFQMSYNLIPFNQTRVPNRFLGNIHEKRQKGIKFWEVVLSNKKDNAYAKFNLGYLLLDNGLYDEAMKEFRALDDENEQGYYGYNLPVGHPGYYLAICLQKKGEWKEAIKEYETLKKKYPGLPWVSARLIALYAATGNPDKAIEEEKILEKLDNLISSSYLLAEAYYQLGFYEKAIEILEPLNSSILERYAPFHFLLSACYAKLGTDNPPSEKSLKITLIKSAIKECSLGLELRPNQNLLYPEISSAYEEAIINSINKGKLYYELGKVYLDLGELEKARTNLSKALIYKQELKSSEIKESIENMINEIDFILYAFTGPEA
ncbi:MAG: tetratricopeptide repeat protein [bacterium]